MASNVPSLPSLSGCRDAPSELHKQAIRHSPTGLSLGRYHARPRLAVRFARRTPSACTTRIPRSRRRELLHRNLFGRVPGLPEIPGSLHSEPRLRRRADALPQPDRHVHGDSRALIDQFGQRLPRDAQALGGSRHRKAQRFEALPLHYAAGCGGVCKLISKSPQSGFAGPSAKRRLCLRSKATPRLARLRFECAQRVPGSECRFSHSTRRGAVSGSLATNSRFRASRLEARPPACQEAVRHSRLGVVARLPGPRRAGHHFTPCGRLPCPSHRNFQLVVTRAGEPSCSFCGTEGQSHLRYGTRKHRRYPRPTPVTRHRHAERPDVYGNYTEMSRLDTHNSQQTAYKTSILIRGVTA